MSDPPETSSSETRPPTPGVSLRVAGLTLLIFLATLPLVKTQTGSANDASRFGAALELAETGRWGLHPAFAWTIDRALRDDGVFISDKPPMLSVFAAGLIRLAAWADGDIAISTLIWLVSALLSALPFALTLWLLGMGLIRGRSSLVSATIALTAVTTLLLPYAVTLSNHCFAAALVMCLPLLIRRVAERASSGAIVLLGLTAGAVPMVDVPVGLVLLVLTAGQVALIARGRVVLFLLGAVPPIAVGLLINHALSHRWLPIYFQGNMYTYPGSAWAEIPSDLSPYPLRVLQRMVTMTIGAHGLVWMWPLGLVALTGLIRTLRSSSSPSESASARWTLCAWVLVMGALIANPSPRGGDISGGFGYGLRWVIPLMAPLMLFLPRGVEALGRLGIATAATLTVWGAMIVAFGVLNPWPACTISRFPPLHNTATLLAERGESGHEFNRTLIRWTARERALGHFDLGMIHHRAGRHRTAAQELATALSTAQSEASRQFDPVLARYYLGISLTELGLFVPAERVYRELLEMDPGNVGARNNFAIALLAQSRPAEALAQAEEAARLDPNSVTAVHLQISALRVLGETDRAETLLLQAAARWPDDPRIMWLLADRTPRDE